MRTTIGVGQNDGVWIDAELLVDGGEDLLDVDRAVLSNLAVVLTDPNGRPQYLVDNRQVIDELV